MTSILERATKFFDYFHDRLKEGRCYFGSPYRHPIKLGKEWHAIYSVVLREYDVENNELKMSLCFIYRSCVDLYGTKDKIVQELSQLLEYGFCFECGRESSKDHVCQNLQLEMLNPQEPLQCSICLETCNGATRLPCGHPFHFGCLSNVYDKSSSAQCPNCRKVAKRGTWDLNHILPIVVYDENDEEEEEAS